MLQPTNLRQQRGAVLAVSLLILLVLTLIGIAGMSSSVLEEKMAANTQKLNETFQTAESSIRKTFTEQVADPVELVVTARDGGTRDDGSDVRDFEYDLGGQASSATTIAYRGEVPVVNSSMGIFAAYGVALRGNSAYQQGSGGDTSVTSVNTQGYVVQPMLPIN